MAANKPVLHHLNVELHERERSGPRRGRAPLTLQQYHYMGKAPQIVLPSGRLIAESSAVAAYLIETYDTAGRFKIKPGDTRNDWIRDEELTSFGGTTMGLLLTLKLMFDMMATAAPFFIRPLFYLVYVAINGQFIDAEMTRQLQHLEREIGDQKYFMGAEDPGRADFILSWPFDMIEQRAWLDLAKEYPKLDVWRKRCQARDAWKESLNQGNGYSLKSF